MKNVEPTAGVGRGVCLLLLAVAALTPAACGGSGLAGVSGTVTYRGKPVPKGTVTFVSTTPGARNATGEIQEDGSYTLHTEQPGDGAAPGEYRVTLYAHDEPVLDYTPRKPVPPKLLVPAKYENPETSGLKATVKGGSNTVNLDLTD